MEKRRAKQRRSLIEGEHYQAKYEKIILLTTDEYSLSDIYD